MSEQEYSYDGRSAFEIRQDLRVNDSYGIHGEFQLVGRGPVTNESCGKFSTYVGCLRADLHQLRFEGDADFDPHDSKRVFVRKVHFSCDKSTCPICYKRGWAGREASRIEERLEKAARRFGEVEHMTASFAPRMWGLDSEELRSAAKKALFSRGVIGGTMIFHGFRYNPLSSSKWFWSPHFHVLGFIAGGYGRCRDCRQQFCSKCDGFEGRQFRLNQSDGFIVKVFDKRKSVGATAYYQLHHATVKVDASGHRNHVATWFGVCSYRKLKVTREKRKAVCPWCKHDLEKLRYVGAKKFVVDRNSPLYVRDSAENFEESGREVWLVASKRRFGCEE